MTDANSNDLANNDEDEDEDDDRTPPATEIEATTTTTTTTSSTTVPSSSSSSDTELSLDYVQSDEMVILQEMLLQSLTKRKALVVKQRESMTSRWEEFQATLVALEHRQHALNESLSKHLQLQHELSMQLIKSEAKLGRTTVTVDSTGQPLQPNHLRTTAQQDMLIKPYIRSTVEADQEDSKQELTEMVQLERQTRHENMIEENMIEEHHDNATESETNEVENFQNSRKPNEDKHAVIDSIVDKPSTQKKRRRGENKKCAPSEGVATWSVRIADMLLDKKEMHYVLKSRCTPITSTSPAFLSLHRLVDGKRLEQMMEVLRDVSAGTDHDADFIRESLYHTCVLLPYHWDHGDNDSTSGSVQTANGGVLFDPNKSLCPYELAGTCADPYCTFQHFKPRDDLQVLAKELMPLPELRLPPPPTNGNTEGIPAPKRAKVAASNTQDVIQQNARAISFKNPKAIVEEDSAKESLDFNDDFLSLPVANAPCDDSSEDGDQRGPRMWWMTQADEERVDKHLHTNTSLYNYLKVVFDMEVIGKDEELICHADQGTPLLMLGRIIDAIKISSHAGRYDLELALLNMCSRVVEKVRGQLHLGMLENWSSRFAKWQPNHQQQRNLFTVALERQILLSLLSHFVSLLSKYQITSNKPLGWILNRIINLFTAPAQNTKNSDDFIATVSSMQPGIAPQASAFLDLAKMCAQIEQLHGMAPQCSEEATEVIDNLDNVRKSATKCLHDPLQTLWTIAQLGFSINNLVEGLANNGIAPRLALRLESKLDNVCTWMLDNYGPSLYVVLTPILGLRVSLMVAVKRYDRAQRSIERQLSIPVCSFSDLLWSQLATLKAHLPSREKAQVICGQLSSRIQRLQVRLNYITLPGDRNLFQPFMSIGNPKVPKKGGSKSWRQSLQASIVMFVSILQKANQNERLLLELNLEAMSLGNANDYPGKLISLSALAFPRSLLYGGSCLRKLNMNCCNLDCLPNNFGEWFPNLKELLLDSNALTHLPSSVAHLRSLVKLSAAGNKLVSLPKEIGGCGQSLEELMLGNNLLESLPESILQCRLLQRIDLKHNRFVTLPSNLVVHLEFLIELDMSGNPCLKPS